MQVMINMDMFTLSRPQPVRYTTFTICQVSDCLGDCKIVFLALLQVSDSLCTGKIYSMRRFSSCKQKGVYSLLSDLSLASQYFYPFLCSSLVHAHVHTHPHVCMHSHIQSTKTMIKVLL